MLRPVPLARPVCPMCGEPGIHASTQKCIEELREQIDKLKAIRVRTSVEATGRYYPSFHDY